MCSQIIPNLLKWANGEVGLRWILIAAGVFVALTIPIALLLRPITMEQLHLLEEHRKKEAAAKAQAQSEASAGGAAIELAEQKKDLSDAKADPDAITSEPKVVTSDENNGLSEGEKIKEKDGVNDPEVNQNLLTPAPESPQSPYPRMEAAEAPVVEVKKEKKKSSIAAALAYFKHMPPLFKKPVYLLHALHFAVIMTIDNIFLSITFDSFLKVCHALSDLIIKYFKSLTH